MHASAGIAVAVVTIASFVQLTPAPPIALAPLVSALITGAGVAIRTALSETGVTYSKRAAHVVRRQSNAPNGVPQEEYDRCEADLNGVEVSITGPIGDTNGIQLDNLPASCMNLATVLIGDPVNGPYPQPCGSACLLYPDLTAEQYFQYRDIFA